MKSAALFRNNCRTPNQRLLACHRTSSRSVGGRDRAIRVIGPIIRIAWSGGSAIVRTAARQKAPRTALLSAFGKRDGENTIVVKNMLRAVFLCRREKEPDIVQYLTHLPSVVAIHHQLLRLANPYTHLFTI
ncbi:hypothetical protein QA646_05445 [Rhizobium sp. CB3090]|uniref:hypothetical protein n=1 Tax=Rhizobium sp. CB3090 TaxID=3039156 RepID=UPI0024B106E8|nr:hypothetical protein [Rhizobium sp. CB3090]WFU10303.1 hypothetical protein QA646_05445 [Rhizobium sp. CB3090]